MPQLLFKLTDDIINNIYNDKLKLNDNDQELINDSIVNTSDKKSKNKKKNRNINNISPLLPSTTVNKNETNNLKENKSGNKIIIFLIVIII